MTTTPLVHLSVPPRWRRRADPDHGVLLAARAPVLSGVPPELVLRWSPVDTDLETWRAGAMHDLAERLVAFEVDDVDRFESAHGPVIYHRFAHRLGLVNVVCDQWSWVVDGVGLTLTGTVACEDYPDYCDVFELVAQSTWVEAAPAA